MGAPFFTIGYQGRTLPDFITALLGAGVERVIDVRELPLSRKRGFSKTPLRAALGEVGVDYVHLRVAGNPYRARRGDIQACLALYSTHVGGRPEIMEAVESAMAGKRSALLCFEADVSECHRWVLVNQLTFRNGFCVVTHL